MNARATLRALVGNATMADLPDLLAEIESAKALAWTRLVAPPALPAPALANVPVSADEASKLTGAPASWLLDNARRGAIPCVRFGKHIRFRVTDVLAAVANNPPLKRRKRREHRTASPAASGKPSNGKGFSAPATAPLPPR